MSIKIVFKNTLYYGFANALQKLGGFFVLFLAALFLTPEQYGHLALISLFSSLAHISISSTIHGAVLRFYVDLEGERRKRFIGSTLIFILGFSFIVILVLFAKGQALVGWLFPRSNIPFYPLFALSLGTLFFLMPQEIANSIFKIKETPKSLLTLLSVSVGLTTVLILAFLTVFRQGIKGIFLGQFLAAVLVFGLCLRMVRKEFVLLFNWELLKPALLFSLPMVPYIFLDFLRNRSAIYFLEKSVAIDKVGLYYFALSVGMIMSAIAGAFASSYSPRMFNLLKEQPLVVAKREYARMFRYIFLLANLAFAAIGLFSEEFIRLFMPKFIPSMSIVPLVVFASFLGGIYLFAHNSFYWVSKTPLVSLSSFGMSVITILAQVLLIPRYGILGGALGLCIGEAAGLAIGFFLSRKVFPVDYGLIAVLPVSLVSVISVFAIWSWVPGGYSTERLALKAAVLGVVFLMTMKKFKLSLRSAGPRIKEMVELFRHG